MGKVSREKRIRRETGDTEKRYGIELMRQSKYPIPIMIEGNVVYLNPLKHMLKNKPYRNRAYQEELDRLINEHLEKKIAVNKVKEEMNNA